MKLSINKLTRLTEDAMKIAGTAMSLLVTNRCPVYKEYEAIETFVSEVETLRGDLGLPKLTSLEICETKREPIGFKLPAAA